MGRSVLLSLSVTFLAMIVGTPLGVLLGKTDLPLRGAFTMLLTLPLLVPPYVIAVAWFAVLGSTGWIGHFLAPTTSEVLSSAFFGFYGCIVTELQEPVGPMPREKLKRRTTARRESRRGALGRTDPY